jgi:hypothetical protein
VQRLAYPPELGKVVFLEPVNRGDRTGSYLEPAQVFDLVLYFLAILIEAFPPDVTRDTPVFGLFRKMEVIPRL